MSTTSKIRANRLEFYDTATFETVLPVAPVSYSQDFLGAAFETIPPAGSPVQGDPFVKRIVGAGPPIVAGILRAPGGQVQIALSATAEKEDAVLYWDDNLAMDVLAAAEFETRLVLPVLPSLAGVQAVWGLFSAWIDGPANNACFLAFGVNGSGAVSILAFDGVTTTTFATGVVVGTTDWHTYRVDANSPTDIRFYIDGVQVSSTGLVNFAATGALAVLQPYLACYKAAGAGVASLTTDYVRVWMSRR